MLDRPITGMLRFPVRWDGVEVGRCRRVRDWRTATARSVEQLVEQEGSAILALDFDDSIERVQPFPRLGRVDIPLRAHLARFLPIFLPLRLIVSALSGTRATQHPPLAHRHRPNGSVFPGLSQVVANHHHLVWKSAILGHAAVRISGMRAQSCSWLLALVPECDVEGSRLACRPEATRAPAANRATAGWLPSLDRLGIGSVKNFGADTKSHSGADVASTPLQLSPGPAARNLLRLSSTVQRLRLRRIFAGILVCVALPPSSGKPVSGGATRHSPNCTARQPHHSVCMPQRCAAASRSIAPSPSF